MAIDWAVVRNVVQREIDQHRDVSNLRVDVWVRGCRLRLPLCRDGKAMTFDELVAVARTFARCSDRRMSDGSMTRARDWMPLIGEVSLEEFPFDPATIEDL